MSTPPWGQEPEEQVPPPPPPNPYGGQPASPYQPYGGTTPYGAYPVAPQTNGLAIASLVVSIVSIPFCCGLTGIVGAIMGHVARKQIREQPNQTGEGLALGAIIVGWVCFGLALIGIVLYVVLIIVGVVASDSLDDCYYDSNDNYVCD
jgi:hypothetical protein